MSSYCLRRNNHCFDLADHFERMFKEESMVDVTLSCGNGCIKAHRMVLSACSSYFNEIFSKFNAPHQYPIVIIKDMPFDDLRSIIEFIYRGEVTVPHNRLSSVLRSAEALKVKGLQDAKSQMDGKSMRKRRKKRRKGNRKTNNDDGGSHDDTSGQGGNSNQNHDANGDTSDNEPGNNNNNNNNGDKSKDGSASEDEATSEYTDEEEDEEMENEINGHGIMVTQHHGRNTNNTDADIEPSRLLEQSMITVDERNERNNGHTPKFQSNLSISDSNLNSDLSLKPIMFGDNGMLQQMNVSLTSPNSIPNSQSTLNSASSLNHVPGISAGPHAPYEASISMAGPSNISPFIPRPLLQDRLEQINSGLRLESNNSGHPHSQVPHLPPAQLLPSIQMHQPLGSHSLSSLTIDSLTGKRHYQCNICLKTFTEKGNMKRHTQIHSHNRSRYMCEICSKCFAWKDNFNRHRRIAHSDLSCK
ncbi:uncharacterized protein LOC141850594 isoform X1 [Brevipalpus obovatus]|uniref:uncharacterized protein LOC141850594 isoform X1 n=1 Tax=Brevipalpus obovatus TaxID=246614 RepID=UPI003D9F0463